MSTRREARGKTFATEANATQRPSGSVSSRGPASRARNLFPGDSTCHPAVLGRHAPNEPSWCSLCEVRADRRGFRVNTTSARPIAPPGHYCSACRRYGRGSKIVWRRWLPLRYGHRSSPRILMMSKRRYIERLEREWRIVREDTLIAAATTRATIRLRLARLIPVQCRELVSLLGESKLGAHHGIDKRGTGSSEASPIVRVCVAT